MPGLVRPAPTAASSRYPRRPGVPGVGVGDRLQAWLVWGRAVYWSFSGSTATGRRCPVAAAYDRVGAGGRSRGGERGGFLAGLPRGGRVWAGRGAGAGGERVLEGRGEPQPSGER